MFIVSVYESRTSSTAANYLFTKLTIPPGSGTLCHCRLFMCWVQSLMSDQSVVSHSGINLFINLLIINNVSHSAKLMVVIFSVLLMMWSTTSLSGTGPGQH